MSGIVGIYYLNGQTVEHQQIGSMVDKIAHRGPDGANVWCSKSIGLGHRMLWTTPESLLEKLPYTNSRNDLVITSDCRIDNRDELLSVLQFGNCPPEKITDSQIILAAYSKWGEECPKHLLGDFAFAIWDEREQKLFCARDHFGIKPFYYYSSSKLFAFASEIKAILCLTEVPRRLNEEKIGDFLSSIFDNTTITFYQDIQRLPPAHSLTVSIAGIKLHRYWSLDSNREIELGSDQEYAEAFCKIFTEAVRCRLRSALPVGSFLSGGLDSSSIACVAEKLLSENGADPLLTFSAVFSTVKECDESFFQNAVLSQGHFQPHSFYADQVGPLEDINRVLWHQDEPFFAGNLFLTSGLYNLAHQQNVRVILDGFDGDSTVSHGVGHLRELALKGRWLTLFDETWGQARNFYLSFVPSFWFYIWRYSVFFKLARRIWLGLRRRIPQKNTNNTSSDWKDCLNSNFKRRIALEQRLLSSQNAQPMYKTERERHYQILTWGLIPYALEMIDKAAAMYAIEPRFPFWDKRLVEFCLALPPRQKFHHGWSRFIMRRAMNNILPKEVQWRPGKTMMGFNFRHGFLNFNQDVIEQVLNQDSSLEKEYLNKIYLNDIFRQLKYQESDEHDVTLWKATILSFWLKKFKLFFTGGDAI